MSKYFSFLRKKRSSLHEEEVATNKGKRHAKKRLGSSPSPSPYKKGLEDETRFSVHNLDGFDDLKEDVFLSDNDSVLDNVSFGEIALEGEADRKGGQEQPPTPKGSPKTEGDPWGESISRRGEGDVDDDEGRVLEANDEDINDFMDEAFNDLEDEDDEAGELRSEVQEYVLSDNHFVTIVPVNFGADDYCQLGEESLVVSDEGTPNACEDRTKNHITQLSSDEHEPRSDGANGTNDDASNLPIVKETSNLPPRNFILDIEDNRTCVDDLYAPKEDGIPVATEATTSTPILSVSFLDEWRKLNEIPTEFSIPSEATFRDSSVDSAPSTIPEDILGNDATIEIDPHFINGEFPGKEIASGNGLPNLSVPTGSENDAPAVNPVDSCPQAMPSEVVECSSGISSVSTSQHVSSKTKQLSNLTTMVSSRQIETISCDGEFSPQIADNVPQNGETQFGGDCEKGDSIAVPEYEDTDAKFEYSSFDTEIEIQRTSVERDFVCATGDALSEDNIIAAEPDGVCPTSSQELLCEETGGLFSDNDTMDELQTKSESSSIPFLSCERPSLYPSDFEEDVFDSAKEELSEDEVPVPERRASPDSSLDERGKDSLLVSGEDDHGQTSCDHLDLDKSGDVEGETNPPNRGCDDAERGFGLHECAEPIDAAAAKHERDKSPEIDAYLVIESDSNQKGDENANKGNSNSLHTPQTLHLPISCEDSNVSSTIPENIGSLPIINDEKVELSSHVQEKIQSEICRDNIRPITSPNSSEQSEIQSGLQNRGLTTISESPGSSVICDQKVCPDSIIPTKPTEANVDQSDVVLPRRAYCISEENFLINVVNSERLRAEARLAQRRAARAEARELRLREIERQQQEQDNNDEEEQCSGTPNAPLATHSPAGPAVNSTFSPSEMSHPRAGRSRSSVAASSVSRRSSEDSTADDALPTSTRELKAELKELDEKFRKAMITNAQLDNEKATLTFEVEFLKDKYSELEETHTQLTKDHRKKCSENEQLRKLSNKLKEEVQMVRRVLQERDELIQEYGLVLIGDEDGEDSYDDMDDPERRDDTINALSPRRIAVKKALLSHEASELLAKGAATGSLDVRLRKYAEDKNDLEDEVRRLKMELEEELSRRRKENGLDHEKQKEASKSLNEYKFRVQKAEAEVSTLQANVARLESLVSRYKASTEQLEQSEEELKSEKRRLQRELREAQNRLEELELTNSHIQKRLDKLKTARSTLLKDLSQEPA